MWPSGFGFCVESADSRQFQHFGCQRRDSASNRRLEPHGARLLLPAIFFKNFGVILYLSLR
jgi:hypothetical protein